MRMVEICIDEMPRIMLTKYKITIDKVFNEVCKIFQLDRKVVSSRWRGRECVFCRFIIAYVTRLLLGYKLAEISSVLGFKDHTSVINCIKKVNEWLDTKDPLFMRFWGKYIAESKIWELLNEK